MKNDLVLYEVLAYEAHQVVVAHMVLAAAFLDEILREVNTLDVNYA